MPTIRRLRGFAEWLSALRDVRAVARITKRLDQLALGNFGDVKPVGEGVSELRIHYGPGYRVYIKTIGREIVVLLCGGDKSTQNADIRMAQRLAGTLKDLTESAPDDSSGGRKPAAH